MIGGTGPMSQSFASGTKQEQLADPFAQLMSRIGQLRSQKQWALTSPGTGGSLDTIIIDKELGPLEEVMNRMKEKEDLELQALRQSLIQPNAQNGSGVMGGGFSQGGSTIIDKFAPVRNDAMAAAAKYLSMNNPHQFKK